MSLRVLYFGTFHSTYPGNSLLIKGLRQNGVEVSTCHVPLGEKTRSKYHSYRSLWSKTRLVMDYALAYVRLLYSYTKTPPHDAIVFGYLGQLDAPLAYVVSRLARKPLIFNPMFSLYDTVILDRGLYPEKSAPAKLLAFLDRFAFSISNITFLDTSEHMKIWTNILGCDVRKIRQLNFGADDDLFFPREGMPEDGPFRVIFYGTYMPTQGVPVIVQAAKLLENEGVMFEIIGYGQDTEAVLKLRDELEPANIHFTDWVPFEELPQHIAASHIALGMFGLSDKMKRCFPNKVVQCIAMGRAVITGDSPSVEEFCSHGDNIFLCEPGDPEALAQAIRTLRNDPSLRRKIEDGALSLYRDRFTPRAVGKKALIHIEEMLQ